MEALTRTFDILKLNLTYYAEFYATITGYFLLQILTYYISSFASEQGIFLFFYHNQLTINLYSPDSRDSSALFLLIPPFHTGGHPGRLTRLLLIQMDGMHKSELDPASDGNQC